MSALVQRWRESASNHANQLALVYEGDSLTYRDLSDQVEQRARKLRAFLGVGYSPVGLAAQETLKEIVDVLALLVLGRPYLYLENDTNCSNALGEKAGIQVVVGRHESSPVSPTAEIGVPDILCLLRTSGTTDRPKLVARSHQAALRNIENYGESCLLTPADRVALTAPPSRGPFLSQLLGGLLHGAEVHVFDFKKRGSAEFGEWLRKTRVTQVHLVPSIFVRTCETLGSQTLPDLSTVRLGGETLRWEQVKLFKRTAPRARILNGYSASEAAGNICCHELQEMREAGIVPVGRPVGGREIMIVDSSGRRLKVGERGRIVVRSRHLASGYWTESVLSQVSFRKDGTEWWSDDEGYLDEE
ncbi:MAG: AMP-binding protein, partial [Candidatus Eremiobacteraeota bacterium]|nr:AMP-binding protein [Candidatus Eremiobacteraeota bacterium]